MKIVNQRKNSSVHLHELVQSHESVFESLVPGLKVEDFNKRVHDNLDLDVS